MTPRARRLALLYRISEEEYERILEYQNGVCAGCLKPPKSQRLAVDHNHRDGGLRNLLCWSCNKTLRFVLDDPNTLRRLANSLENPSFTAVLGPRYGLIGQAKRKKVMKYGPGA